MVDNVDVQRLLTLLAACTEHPDRITEWARRQVVEQAHRARERVSLFRCLSDQARALQERVQQLDPRPGTLAEAFRQGVEQRRLMEHWEALVESNARRPIHHALDLIPAADYEAWLERRRQYVEDLRADILPRLSWTGRRRLHAVAFDPSDAGQGAMDALNRLIPRPPDPVVFQAHEHSQAPVYIVATAGRLIAGQPNVNRLKVWTLGTDWQRRRLQNPDGKGCSGITAAGKWMVSLSTDPRYAALWRLGGRLIGLLHARANIVAVSVQGAEVATWYADGSAERWRLDNGRKQGDVPSVGHAVRCAGGNNAWVAIAGDGRLTVLDAASYGVIRTWRLPAPLVALCCDEDAVYAAADRSVHRFRVASGTVEWDWITARGPISAVAVSARVVVVGTQDAQVSAYGRRSGCELLFGRLRVPIQSVAAAGGVVAAAHAQGGILQWRLTDD